MVGPHPALSAVLAPDEGVRWKQTVRFTQASVVKMVDLREHQDEDQETFLDVLAHRASALARVDDVNAVFIVAATGNHNLSSSLVVHHLVSDWASLSILARQLREYYPGKWFADGYLDAPKRVLAVASQSSVLAALEKWRTIRWDELIKRPTRLSGGTPSTC